MNKLGFTNEYRIYSWRQSYSDVTAVAGQELTAYGFKLEKTSDRAEYVVWSRGDGYVVSIQPMQSHDRREAIGGKGVRDRGWVTVTIADPVPNTWLTHLRYALEPNDY